MLDLVQDGLSRDTRVPRTDVIGPAAATSRRALIRAFAASDLPAVAALFIRLFRAPLARRGSLDLEHCLRDVLLRPERPITIPPGLVSVGRDGAVGGFVACATQPMRLGSRRLTGLGGGTLMFDPLRRGDATALIRLLRTFFDIPHDLSFTDTASPVSRAILEKMGASILPMQSIDWVIARSPIGLVLRVGLDRLRTEALDRALGAAIRAWMGWSGGARGAGRRRPEPGFVTPSLEGLAEAVVRLAGDYPLRPAWEDDRAPLLFRLGEARKVRRHGPLAWRVAFDAAGDPVGCWLAYLRPGGVGRALQVLARAGRAEAVFADLTAEADRVGCVALRGRLQPDLLPALTRQKCVFLPRLATLVRSSDPGLLRDCLAAPALLTGLAGETWSRIFEDDFTPNART